MIISPYFTWLSYELTDYAIVGMRMTQWTIDLEQVDVINQRIGNQLLVILCKMCNRFILHFTSFFIFLHYKTLESIHFNSSDDERISTTMCVIDDSNGGHECRLRTRTRVDRVGYAEQRLHVKGTRLRW